MYSKAKYLTFLYTNIDVISFSLAGEDIIGDKDLEAVLSNCPRLVFENEVARR